MSVGQRIAQRRGELGFNQTELAQKAGLKPAAINQYESGERRPSYEALIKLAGALKVTTDNLIGGDGFSQDVMNDPTVKTILKMVGFLSEDKKMQLLNFGFYLLNQDFSTKYPVLGDVADYAEFLLRDTSFNLPVNINAITNNLNLKIIETTDAGYEGILFKDFDGGLIVLDNIIEDKNRRRFTIAHLLGHFVIPWHMKKVFYCRKYGTSLLQTDDIMEMEANNFAAALLMPKFNLERDLLKKRPTLDQLETLAHQKYHVSLFALTNRLIEYTVNKHALINSKNNKIEKTFQGNRPLVENLQPNTFAAEFFANPPAEKTTRCGSVPASYWFDDASQNEMVYEESMYNPMYKAVLTLLTSENSIS